MRTTFLHQGDVIDSDAVRIGALYKKGNIIGNVQYFIEAGQLLLQKKAALGHGAWLPWLKNNEATLGFDERHAQRLMHAANTTPASDMNESEALAISRDIWGHKSRKFWAGEDEWYTPAEYIDRARAVLGGIDLDPASHPIAQRIVNATTFYTKADDGLAHKWHGRVWLNPPYSRPLIAKFVAKLCAERGSGRVTAAIMVTHNFTDTAWFHNTVLVADAICFLRGRIRFYSTNGFIAAPPQGQVFFYFGADVSSFVESFGQIGFVVNGSQRCRKHHRCINGSIRGGHDFRCDDCEGLDRCGIHKAVADKASKAAKAYRAPGKR
jgi:phage N-6-adenine-methyltransferase